MTETEYAENTPEYRIAQLAREGSGLSDEEVLKGAGYVPHDGTLMRDDLLAQYREEVAFSDRTADGLKADSASWALSQRSTLEAAQAFGDHVASLWRSGELVAETPYESLFRGFAATREREPEAG